MIIRKNYKLLTAVVLLSNVSFAGATVTSFTGWDDTVQSTVSSNYAGTNEADKNLKMLKDNVTALDNALTLTDQTSADANTKATNALSSASTANSKADSAIQTAQTADANSANAVNTAQAADTNSAKAVSTATTADARSKTAENNSIAAVSHADQARSQSLQTDSRLTRAIGTQSTINSYFQNSVNDLNRGLNRLDNKVDQLNNKVNRGLASQSALSGLFQPYGVGKFNTSVALGGYESENALAVGGGYRFNEHLAVKAGVATNTSNFEGTAYNAAINMEW